MALKQPENMDELLYFTRRKVGDGRIMAWVYKADCPECGKAKMGKPVGDDGKVKIRAKVYECPECGYTEPKKDHEEVQTLEAVYTCPHCGKEGEATTEYKRRTLQGIKSYVLKCEHCGEKIPVTKKMKGVDI